MLVHHLLVQDLPIEEVAKYQIDKGKIKGILSSKYSRRRMIEEMKIERHLCGVHLILFPRHDHSVRHPDSQQFRSRGSLGKKELAAGSADSACFVAGSITPVTVPTFVGPAMFSITWMGRTPHRSFP